MLGPLPIGLTLLWTVDPVEANSLSAVGVQDLDRVAIEDGDDGTGEFACWSLTRQDEQGNDCDENEQSATVQFMAMTRVEVRKGLCIRLLVDHVTVPEGTTGEIEEVNLCDSRWYFIVSWDQYVEKPLFRHPKSRTRIVQPGSHSLRLTEDDIQKFEAITREERAAAAVAFDSLHAKKKTGRLSARNVTLLPLPFGQAEMFRNGVWSAE